MDIQIDIEEFIKAEAERDALQCEVEELRKALAEAREENERLRDELTFLQHEGTFSPDRR